MKLLTISLLLASSAWLSSQEPKRPQVMSKGAQEIFLKHAADCYFAAKKVEGDLELSIPDERVLLHLPKRGFPYLASFPLSGEPFMTWVGSTLWKPEENLDSGTREEAVAGELISRAIVNRVKANRLACFHLLKELAPTPEAMKLEQHAKDLWKDLSAGQNFSSDAEFLQKLEKVREMYDQLKDLPKMTPEEFAKERAESAVLAPEEYTDDVDRGVLGAKRKWPDSQIAWQQKWNHQGYVFVYSEHLNQYDYAQSRMVVSEGGGIFEWRRESGEPRFPRNSYESRLPEAELRALKVFLTQMPESDAPGKGTHFVISFLKDGRWLTRTYNTLPTGSPFENLLKRMSYWLIADWDENAPAEDGFLKALPEGAK